MLNIGKLSPGAANYYIGEVASSSEDYYLGSGEAKGRWVGSLAASLGLSGEVGETEFRRVLDGRHPFTGEYLVSAVGSASRAQARRVQPMRDPTADRGEEHVDCIRAAARLGVGVRHVQKLLQNGERAVQALLELMVAGSTTTRAPSSYLVGTKLAADPSGRVEQWRVTQAEIDRHASTRNEKKARPGYDLTLRPPKSVSVLWALGTPDQRRAIRAAHTEAVDEVVAYYESQALFGRSGSAGRHRVLTDGLVAAAFDHRTSRAGDPLLHTHVVVANMTRTVEGNWRAIDGRPLYEHARAADALYQAHLRHVLTRELGVDWHPAVNGWADVRGVPDEVIAAFSKRRAEIEEIMAESGYSSPRARQAATLLSRKAKDYRVDADTLDEVWLAEAAEFGFDRDAVSHCFGQAEVVTPTPELIDRLHDRLSGPAGLTERASTFTRREVVVSIATALGSSLTATELAKLTDRFLASPRVVSLDEAGHSRVERAIADGDGRRIRLAGEARFTTPELLALETRLLTWAREGFDAAVPLASTEAVEAAIAARPELSAEQVAMVRATCLDPEAIQPIAGRPGAGKTYAMDACVAALVGSGVPVAGCAVSATAAAELEAATALERATGRPAMTVARLLIELDDPDWGGFASGTVLIVDEASMVGTRDLFRLGAHLARSGGGMKLIGDPDQHASVDTGGIFRRLVADKGDALVRLVENNRQVEENERLAIDDYRRGLIAEALSRYDEEGKIVRKPTAAACFDAMVADWYLQRCRGGADPMIAGPNSTRRALNTRARVLLKAEGELEGPGLWVAAREFVAGDEVIARHNDRSLHAPARRDFVKNGSSGTVLEVDTRRRELVVAFAKEGTIRLPATYLDPGWLEHGYARTSYSVQGATHERGAYHPSDVSSYEEGYVALTRARLGTRIYVVEGSLLSDHDDGHGGEEPEETSLETVTDALRQRRARTLALEADPRAAEATRGFGGWSLAQLAAEHDRLSAWLAAMPASARAGLDAAERRKEALLARRQLWVDSLNQATAVAQRRGMGQGRGSRRTAKATTAKAAAEVERLDRSITRLEKSMAPLADRQRAYETFLAEHREEIDRQALVRSAERARELQVRVAARTDPARELLTLLGPEPEDQPLRLAWARAVEAVAVYADRHGRRGARDRANVVPAVLGERPPDPLAAAAYEDAALAIENARPTITAEPQGPVVEVV